MVALHNGERAEYSSDGEFWSEMFRRAKEEIEFEDHIEQAGDDIEGTPKPRTIWSFVTELLGDIITVGIAYFIAHAW